MDLHPPIPDQTAVNPPGMTTLMDAFRTKLDRLDDLLSDLGYRGDLADELRELAECIPEDAAMIMVKSR
jgi:hypothetical protein